MGSGAGGAGSPRLTCQCPGISQRRPRQALLPGPLPCMTEVSSNPASRRYTPPLGVGGKITISGRSGETHTPFRTREVFREWHPRPRPPPPALPRPGPPALQAGTCAKLACLSRQATDVHAEKTLHEPWAMTGPGTRDTPLIDSRSVSKRHVFASVFQRVGRAAGEDRYAKWTFNFCSL